MAGCPNLFLVVHCLLDDYAWRIIDLALSPIGAAGLSLASVGWVLAISCIWRMIASPRFFGVGTAAGFAGVGAAWWAPVVPAVPPAGFWARMKWAYSGRASWAPTKSLTDWNVGVRT